MSFFELRIYEVFEGQTEKWVKYFNEEIIPFQTQRGMVIHGAFNVVSTDTFSLVQNERVMDTHQHPNIFTWIRRFEDVTHKEKLYKRVYESKEWLNDYRPKISTMINLDTVIVHNLSALEMSVMK
tara:strand:- start:73 stop:447 length:375 start_codon:yes stop_codon:yes gene_type:complete